MAGPAEDVGDQDLIDVIVFREKDAQGTAECWYRPGLRQAPSSAAISSAAGISTAAVKWKVLPRPSSLSSQIRPPNNWTSSEAIERPRPAPPYLWDAVPFAWTNGAKIGACSSGAMPIPVSCTGEMEDCGRAPVRLGIDADPHFPSFRELHRVVDEIHEDLADAPRIADQDLGERAIGLEGELHPFVGGAERGRGEEVLQVRAPMERHPLELDPPGLEPRVIEEIVHQYQQTVGRGLRHL